MALGKHNNTKWRLSKNEKKLYAEKWFYLSKLFFSFSFPKAKAVIAKVGYPEFIMNDTYINEDIKTVSVRLAVFIAAILCSVLLMSKVKASLLFGMHLDLCLPGYFYFIFEAC